MDCDIIKDLLPLYAENMTSEKSNQEVRKHIASCQNCNQYFNELNEQPKTAPDFRQSVKPLKKIQLKLLFVAVLLVAAVSLLWGLVLMQPGDEMAYSLLVFYLLIPLAGCVVSGILTLKTSVVRWFSPFLFAVINTVIPMIVFGGGPEFIMTALAFGASVFGMLVQFLIMYIKVKVKK